MGNSVHGRGAPLPPPKGPAVYPIWWARPGDPDLDVTALADSWEGYYVHWLPADGTWKRGRDELCLDAGEGCSFHHLALKWVGYLPVYNHPKRLKGALLLTPRAARDLEELAKGRQGLYACRLKLWHTGPGAAGGVRAATSSEPPVFKAPEPIDLQETLRVLWRLPRVPNDIIPPLGKGDTIPFPEPEERDRYGLGGAKGGVR